jgi:hypothetical protein
MLLFFLASPLFLLLLMLSLGFRAWDGAVFLWLFFNALLSPLAGAGAAFAMILIFSLYTMFMVVRLSR